MLDHHICDKKSDEVYIFLLSNEQPIIFTQLMQGITTVPGTSYLSMVSSDIILILNIENNFKNDLSSISFYACNIIP